MSVLNSQSVTVQGRGLALLAGLLWSFAGIFIKSFALPALMIVAYRSLFASLFFGCFLRRRTWKLSYPLALSVVSYTAAISFFIVSNQLTTAANAIILQYTAPAFIYMILRLVFREAIQQRNLLTLSLSMLGVAVIFVGSGGGDNLWGVSVALLSGLLLAVFMINLRNLASSDPVAVTFLNNLACFLILLPFIAADAIPSHRDLISLAVMGVVQLGIPYFLFSKALEKIPLQEASLVVLVEPVLNPLWVAWGVGELPSTSTLLGGGMILFSLAIRYTWLTRGRR
ncbi:MAG: EamA family transporter [Deltaproteobacteria bacterium]|nr:EamA family transporter [Deltaproteobacteria bacterium]